ncbi:MAG: PspC domain-containing protein [Ruminococcus sp.]|uniref:PspC domain-containing protein n=1 Tax=Ruminococcus sp. TaxID=41978 RepID=UPI002873EF36|nr:PspC domain-containing protein [Ruminococcus sp.]MBQ3284688.1 PspC domain-containing protein [Ruminococcus sp.]
MFCKKCGTENNAGVKFCKKCGNPLKEGASLYNNSGAEDNNGITRCKKCGTENKEGTRFCKKCGCPLGNGSANKAFPTKNGSGWYKTKRNKIITGVCAGLAEKSNINPWILRIILIVTNFFVIGWFLDIAYIVLAFILKYDDSDDTISDDHTPAAPAAIPGVSPQAAEYDNKDDTISDDHTPAAPAATPNVSPQAAEEEKQSQIDTAKKHKIKELRSIIDTPKIKEKRPKSVKLYILITAILAAVIITLVILFIIFNNNSNHKNGENTQSTIAAVSEKPTEIDTTEALTEVSTEASTAEPTEAPKPAAEPTEYIPKEDNQTSDSFNSYLIWLDVGVSVREQPDPFATVTYKIETATKYTIVDEAYDSNGTLWGKLKSGIGWINIEAATSEDSSGQSIMTRRRYYMGMNPRIVNEYVGDISVCYAPGYSDDQMTPEEEGYYERITSLSAENVSGNTYQLHIKGDYQTNIDRSERVCCYELGDDYLILKTHYLSDFLSNEEFDIDTSISVRDDTVAVFIEIGPASVLLG